MQKIKAQTLKGFRDFLPGETRKRQYVISKLTGIFESFGFEPLETPALEYEEVLMGKYGEEGDKLMYRFKDNGGRKVALRYDQTVPLARVAAQYSNILPTPFKRYQIQTVWRAENTQKGRFRELLQCDIDTVGSSSLVADVEIIACVLTSVKELGFKNVQMLINDRAIFGGLEPKFVSAIDKLEKIGKEGVISELITKGMNKQDAEKLVRSFDDSKPTALVLKIFDLLNNLGFKEGVDYVYKASLARGLDYYTSTIFELVSDDYKSGSLAGGGRYDKLVGMFSGRDIPAVGIAYGFDRIIEAMNQLNLFPKDLTTTEVLVTIFSQDLQNNSLEVSSKLRASNVNTEVWLDTEAKLDKQLKYADQKGIPYAIIIGPDEAKSGKLVLKDLKNRTQEVVTIDEAIGSVKD
ncbi:histidine--tRNA ligase [Candidatus Daviesbacteria bacterium]|nr:histidine--tRNA ligase [Candidatus Daviesbacteria bacterium]